MQVVRVSWLLQILNRSMLKEVSAGLGEQRFRSPIENWKEVFSLKEVVFL